MRKEDQWNKQGKHEILGDESCRIEAYAMAPTDVCEERRNFPGYESYTPGEDLMNAVSCEGTTETRGGKDMNHAHDPYKSPTIHLKRRYK